MAYSTCEQQCKFKIFLSNIMANSVLWISLIEMEIINMLALYDQFDNLHLLVAFED